MVTRIPAIFLILYLSFEVMSAPAFTQAEPVSDYRVFFAECRSPSKSGQLLSLRKFERNSKPFILTVDTGTLKTAILPSKSLELKPVSMEVIQKKYSNTPYVKALHESKSHAQKIQNAGFTHFLPSEKGVNLTADLCPSHLPFDRVLITSVLKEFGKIESPVPIGLSVTGLWMEKHGGDLSWLKSLEKKRMISITWINHSYSHKFSKKLPLRDNFLLEKDTNLDYEVLATEKKMIEEGLFPSVFFRFPGLVSDLSVLDRIADYGLISLGSDAWLAKKQWPRNGSIVLVHGNGNEPLGIKEFISLLRTENTAILNRQWFLYDLRESVEDYESGKAD